MKHFNKVRLNNPETIWHSFYPGEMMLLSALEGVGKLSMALNLACIALLENIKVNYITIHNNHDLVSERFKIILYGVVDNISIYNNFKIIDTDPNEQSLLNQLKRIENNTLVIIDYLQAIKTKHDQLTNYEIFLHSLKEITKERNLRLLILSQATKEDDIQLVDYMDDRKKLLRHFSHYLHLDHTDDHQLNKRELILLKSTHYQCHETLLSFSKKSFIFDTVS